MRNAYFSIKDGTSIKDRMSIKDRTITLYDIKNACLSEDLEFVKFIVSLSFADEIFNNYKIEVLISRCTVPIAKYLIDIVARDGKISQHSIIDNIFITSYEESNIPLINYLKSIGCDLMGRMPIVHYYRSNIVDNNYIISTLRNYTEAFKCGCLYNDYDLIRHIMTRHITWVIPMCVDYCLCIEDNKLRDEVISLLPAGKFYTDTLYDIVMGCNIGAVRHIMDKYKDSIKRADLVDIRGSLDGRLPTLSTISRIRHINPDDITDDIFDEYIQGYKDIIDLLDNRIKELDI